MKSASVPASQARQVAGLSIVVLLLACALNCSRPRQDRGPESGSLPAAVQPVRSHQGFASREKLVEHFEKHSREFGAISIEDYLRMAQELRDRGAGGNILEAVRPDGVVTRFDRSTGSFVAFNAEGTIRTFFKPNAGESYFRRQSQRGE